MDNKKIPLEEVVSKFNKQNKEFINNLDKEEIIENSISYNDLDNKIKNEIKALSNSTEIKKKDFINKIKNGLGKEVKENKNKIIINKKKVSKITILFNFLKGIFTKF